MTVRLGRGLGGGFMPCLSQGGQSALFFHATRPSRNINMKDAHD